MSADSQHLPGSLFHAATDDACVLLERIAKRVLWLSTEVIHYANFVRDNPEGEKIGGHQASSASMVSLMTALYFDALRPGDLVSVKPHASPVFHAIQFLLGSLPGEKLRELRGYGGLQAYPSRTKDLDGVDFSTGSVGLGAVIPNFAALIQRYIADHFRLDPTHRFFALLGDAELDEGNVWEAIGDDNFRGLDQITWVIDLNRQSLDRVIPSGRAQTIAEVFRTHGWHVIELKYGRKLEEYFSRPAGNKLRRRIDHMSNEEYQSLFRLSDGPEIRERLASDGGAVDSHLLDLLRGCPDGKMLDLVADLGGHDISRIRAAYRAAAEIKGRPVVIVAYTVKGWGLPIAGDPLNHSRLLTKEQRELLKHQLGVAEGDEFGGFPDGSPEGELIGRRSRMLKSKLKVARAQGPVPLEIPESLDAAYRGFRSSQQAFGTAMTGLSRLPEVASRIVTASPDVSLSTHLGGWINKMGIYGLEAKPDYFSDGDTQRMLNWKQHNAGQHIELGISEMNFFLLLAAMGLSSELFGEELLPVGTLYDAFIPRGLDALMYGAYSESKFIFAGTPSGISLSREGGAHQSLVTPSIGIEVPNLVYYEPCFGQELEWILLASLKNLLDRKSGEAVYLRLSTTLVDQGLFSSATTDPSLLREQVLLGGYRVVDRRELDGYVPNSNVVNIFVSGAMVPHAIEASDTLLQRDVFANVVNVTSPDLLYRAWRTASSAAHRGDSASHLDTLIPEEEQCCPIVTVMDGHSHTLAFLGSVFGARTIPLGVDDFGQTGSRTELYERYGIGTVAIMSAADAVLSGFPFPSRMR